MIFQFVMLVYQRLPMLAGALKQAPQNMKSRNVMVHIGLIFLKIRDNYLSNTVKYLDFLVIFIWRKEF